MKTNVCAIILASGTGSRVGGDIPKQYIRLADGPVTAYALRAFATHPGIARVLLVVSGPYLSLGREIVAQYGAGRFIDVVPGGDTRHESVVAALKFVHEEKVIIHDGARPFVSAKQISACVEELSVEDAVASTLPSSDTIYALNDEGTHIVRVPTRSGLHRAQTPMGFSSDLLKRAYARAEADGIEDPSIEEVSIVLAYDPSIRVRAIAGSSANIKLTYPEDVDYAIHFAKSLKERESTGGDAALPGSS